MGYGVAQARKKVQKVPSNVLRTSRCRFCDKELPEPGHSHIVYVQTTFDDTIPVCVNCMAIRKYKPAILVRAR